MTNGEDLLTVPEVSTILCCSDRHVYGLFEDKSLKYINVGRGKKKKRYLVPRKFVQELLDSRING